MESQKELTEGFMSNFTEQKCAIRERIDKLSLPPPSGLNDILTSVNGQIQRLSKHLHDATSFLPSYSVKVRQEEIRDLEKLLRDKEDLLIPKRKFGFKGIRKIPVVPVPVPDPISHSMRDNPSDGINLVDISVTAEKLLNEDSNYVTIEGQEVHSTDYDEKQLNGNDVLVRNLTGATLSLLGSPSTLRLLNLKKCNVLCGPVHTSVFVDNCHDCVLFLCCQQLRTHSSENLDVYLKVRSRAIIEDCTNIRFGPYSWNSEKSRLLHEQAGIEYDLEKYDAVDDFNWLSATSKSPNWSVVPPSERISFETLLCDKFIK